MAARLGTAVLYLNGDDSNLKKTLGGVQNTVKSAFGGVGRVPGQCALVCHGRHHPEGHRGHHRQHRRSRQVLVTEAMNAERGQAQLNSVIKSTGGRAKDDGGRIRDYVRFGQPSATIPLEDDVITGAAVDDADLHELGKNIFPAATQAAMDMAFAMNNGVTPSAEESPAQNRPWSARR